MQDPALARMPASAIDFEHKICSRDEAISRVAVLPRPLVLTNGVFDVLHRGHATYLAQAHRLGATLVVGVNSDASTRRLAKGEDRPINGQDDRVALIAALAAVDLVTIFDEDNPVELVRALHPDVYVKGGDYDVEKYEEARLVKSWGGLALAIPFVHTRSTTALLERIRKSRSP